LFALNPPPLESPELTLITRGVTYLSSCSLTCPYLSADRILTLCPLCARNEITVLIRRLLALRINSKTSLLVRSRPLFSSALGLNLLGALPNARSFVLKKDLTAA